MDFTREEGLADWSVITYFREETFFGDGADGSRHKVQGHPCCGQRSIEDRQRCWTTPSTTSSSIFGKKILKSTALSGFSFASTMGLLQSLSVKVFSLAWTITGPPHIAERRHL